MAGMRFAVFWQRLCPFFGYNHLLMICHIVVIVLTSILLAGCSSYSSMTNIYILGLSYTNSTPSNLSPIMRNLSDTLNSFKGSSQLEVRAGYFGLCIRQRGVVWLCSSDADGLAQQIGPENDPLNLIGAAANFRSDVIFSGLLFMAIVLAFLSMVLLSTFPNWHQERDEHTGSDVAVKPFPSRPISQAAMTQTFAATILLLVASLWQHIGSVGAAAMMQSASYGNVRTDIGTSAMVMAWAGFTIEACVTIGLVVMILSIIILDRLTDMD